MNARKIAVIGGTGPHSRGLAQWLAAAGHEIRSGSAIAGAA
jgi:predicted dinucleotide-binding enzyme